MAENSLNDLHTYEEVFKAVNKLPKQERDIILTNLNLEQVARLMDSKEALDKFCNDGYLYAYTYYYLSEALQKTYEEVNRPVGSIGKFIQRCMKQDNKNTR